MVFTTSPVQPTSAADEIPSAITIDESCMFSVINDTVGIKIAEIQI